MVAENNNNGLLVVVFVGCGCCCGLLLENIVPLTQLFPVVTDIPPDFPDVEYPDNHVTSPDTPAEPNVSRRVPELPGDAMPVSIFMELINPETSDKAVLNIRLPELVPSSRLEKEESIPPSPCPPQLEVVLLILIMIILIFNAL